MDVTLQTCCDVDGHRRRGRICCTSIVQQPTLFPRRFINIQHQPKRIPSPFHVSACVKKQITVGGQLTSRPTQFSLELLSASVQEDLQAAEWRTSHCFTESKRIFVVGIERRCKALTGWDAGTCRRILKRSRTRQDVRYMRIFCWISLRQRGQVCSSIPQV